MEATQETPSILLLERDTDVIRVARRALRRDVEVHVASTVELALRVAERRPVVIALLDATMAGLHPMDTVAKLRALRPGLRIIFLALPTLALDRRYGMIGPVVRKPVTDERLVEAVRYVLRLQGMTTGIQQMRESSGQIRAVRLPAAPFVAPPASFMADDEPAPSSRSMR